MLRQLSSDARLSCGAQISNEFKSDQSQAAQELETELESDSDRPSPVRRWKSATNPQKGSEVTWKVGAPGHQKGTDIMGITKRRLAGV